MTPDDDNVSEDPTPPQLIAAETSVQTLPLEHTEHVRIGGKPGLRVQHNSVGGVMHHKRVTAGNDEPMGVMLPREVFAALKTELARADASIIMLRDILKPFMG